MKSLVITMSVCLFVLLGCNKHQGGAITVLEKPAFKKAITEKEVQLVDVRTASEYDSGHIENALNIDVLDALNFENSINTLDREEPIYIYCHSGKRSAKAALQLDSLGFKKIFDLKGGYVSWK